MTKRKQVGVVLPVYNQEEEYVYECIASLEKQTYRDFKLVIVLDGANSTTVQAVDSAVRKLTVPYDILKRSQNKGIAFSLNEGFSRLDECDYFTWVSSDNRHKPNFLSELVKAMQSAPADVVLVYSLFYGMNKSGVLRKNKRFYRRLKKLMPRAKELILQHNYFGPSFLFKKGAYKRAGMYNSAYEKVEDYEFWLRLLKIGEARFIPKYLMDYRYGGRFAYTTVTLREEISLKMVQAALDFRKQNGDIPKVSVVISAFNQEKYLMHAVESVLAQTYTDFHLIVINDGSTDKTKKVISRLSDPRVILVNLSTNRGKPAVMNIGMQFALGKYILDLDGDDWLEPETLEVMVKEMEQQPQDFALAYANRRRWKQRNNKIRIDCVVSGLPFQDKYDFLSKMKSHCPRFYRKSALVAVGGWQTEIDGEILLGEDIAMMLLLADKFRFHWIDRTLYNQRRHKTNMSTLQKKAFIAQLKVIVKEALERWGGEYTPRFITENASWILGVELIKKNALVSNAVSVGDYNVEKNVLDINQVLYRIQLAVANKEAFSLSRFGHGEIAELTWQTETELRSNMEYYREYAGATASYHKIGDDLVEALKTATVTGVLLLQDDPKRIRAEAFQNFLNEQRIALNSVCSALIAFEMIKNELFWYILQTNQVILVGRRAKEAVPVFSRRGVSVTGTVDLDNYNQLAEAQTALSQRPDWQIALIAAGIPATILAPRLALSTGRVAIDFGHALDILIQGTEYDFKQIVKRWREKQKQ